MLGEKVMATRPLWLRWVLLLLMFVGSHAENVFVQAVAGPNKRILILYENQATLPAVVQVAAGLRESMLANMPLDMEIYSEYLDTDRFPDPANVIRIADYLISKYASIRFDMVLAGGPGALRFALDHRSSIGNDAPIVFGAVSDTSLRNKVLPPDVKGIVSHFDVRKTIDLALTLQPDARRIVIMTGTSGFDRTWQATAKEALTDSYRGVPVDYRSDLTLDGYKAVASALPRDTILMVLNIFEDAAGRKFYPRDATQAISSVSKAPAYSVYSSHFGAGVLAGYVGTFEDIGKEMGMTASRILAGDLSGPQTYLLKGGPLIDWNLVKHWGIDPARIPEGSQILNYQMSAWEKYRIEILTMLTVILLQAATIVALFLERRRKLRLQTELNLERLELAYLSRTSQLGELSGALAHELNQPLTSILSNAESGSRLLENKPIDVDEIRDILNDIVLDNKRAATVITQLRRLMIRGETSREPIDLNYVTTTTLALARSELLARQTKVEVMLDMPEVLILGNMPQLQQVLLNLILNATDAMSNMTPSQREIAIQTKKRENGMCELTVTDHGVGIAAGRHLDMFKPFVSTKKSSLGLGLAICRSIVQAHGGTLQFDEKFEKGARAILVLPSA